MNKPTFPWTPDHQARFERLTRAPVTSEEIARRLGVPIGVARFRLRMLRQVRRMEEEAAAALARRAILPVVRGSSIRAPTLAQLMAGR